MRRAGQLTENPAQPLVAAIIDAVRYLGHRTGQRGVAQALAVAVDEKCVDGIDRDVPDDHTGGLGSPD